TSYMIFLNVNRQNFANINDDTKVVSAQTEEQRANTYIAMNNIHFRRALSMSVDRGAYNAQKVGEELKLVSLRNSYTPWNFVYLEEDVTVDINGKAKKFKAGTPYGEVMQAQIDADNVNIKVYDPKADNGNGSGDGYDGWYDPENAMGELNVAVKQLAEAGLVIDANNPIVIDYPYPSNSEAFTNQANALKQSIESASNGLIQINLTEAKDYNEWYWAGYFADYGYEANYDIYDCSGWGPDYGDPSTYLDTYLPDYAGYMIKCIGIY
ncbi:MAG: peptide ABC transporter substrate-binding protein, partial [Candidatus Flemingiibacterium sp.]